MENQAPVHSDKHADHLQEKSDAPGAKWILAGVGAAVVVGLIMYLIGVYQGRQRVTEAQRQLQTIEAELGTTREALAQARDHGRLSWALALLYQTTSDLDQRNFGVANTRLQEAAGVLGGVESDSLNTPELQSLQRELQETNIQVASNLEEQRSRINTYATRLRALIPEPASP